MGVDDGQACLHLVKSVPCSRIERVPPCNQPISDKKCPYFGTRGETAVKKQLFHTRAEGVCVAATESSKV